MIFDIFNQTNFLDVIIVILIFRICYIAAKTGFAIELFKLLGVIFATFISLHYYTNVADTIHRGFFPKDMPLEFADFLIFVSLALAAYFGFVVLRNIFFHFIKLEAVPVISKFGGLILGLIRSFFIAGLLIYALSISAINYLSSSVKHSYLGSRSFSISPNTYGWLWNNFASKFLGKDNFNTTVNEVSERFGR